MPLELSRIIECQRPARSPLRRVAVRKKIAPLGRRLVDQLMFQRDLAKLVKRLRDKTRERLFDLLERLESQFMRDVAGSWGDDIQAAFSGLRQEFSDLDDWANQRSRMMAEGVDKAHERRFFAKLKKIAGVDLAGVIDRERLDAVLQAKVRENVNLIKSIPEEYFVKLETMVYENAVQGRTTAKSLQSQIGELWDITDNRAKFIARDQTAKLNSAINTERNIAAGIVEYEWRATGGESGDGRTRENHRKKHGKIYRFDKPPADTGHPGEDFQCRCTARSIIPIS